MQLDHRRSGLYINDRSVINKSTLFLVPNFPANPGATTAPEVPKLQRQRRKEARPQELLQAALDLFVEKGFFVEDGLLRSEDIFVEVSWFVEVSLFDVGSLSEGGLFEEEGCFVNEGLFEVGNLSEGGLIEEEGWLLFESSSE